MPLLKTQECSDKSEEKTPEIAEFEVESRGRNQDTNEDEDLLDDGDEMAKEQVEEAADPGSYWLTRDREKRSIHAPLRYGHGDLVSYALSIAEDIEYQEPRNYAEAMRSKDRARWMLAIREELNSLESNITWILVDKPKTHKLISCKWIFKRKIEVTGTGEETVRFKARLVVRGFTQRESIDFNEVFSPVVKHCSIRILLALVNQYDMIFEQLDVKTAFLHGDLEETIYMCQPEGFILPENEGKACLLKKSLYGLKQSSRQWYKKFDEHMLKIGFSRSCYDSCAYLKVADGVPVAYLLLYVDDMLIASRSTEKIRKLKSDLKSKFEMKELGHARRILGMDI